MHSQERINSLSQIDCLSRKCGFGNRSDKTSGTDDASRFDFLAGIKIHSLRNISRGFRDMRISRMSDEGVTWRPISIFHSYIYLLLRLLIVTSFPGIILEGLTVLKKDRCNGKKISRWMSAEINRTLYRGVHRRQHRASTSLHRNLASGR